MYHSILFFSFCCNIYFKLFKTDIECANLNEGGILRIRLEFSDIVSNTTQLFKVFNCLSKKKLENICIKNKLFKHECDIKRDVPKKSCHECGINIIHEHVFFTDFNYEYLFYFIYVIKCVSVASAEL